MRGESRYRGPAGYRHADEDEQYRYREPAAPLLTGLLRAVVAVQLPARGRPSPARAGEGPVPAARQRPGPALRRSRRLERHLPPITVF
jgi:hypothetical protein